ILISTSSPVEIDSWQFDLAFTASLLKANSVTEGSFLSESGTKTTLFSPGVIDNATGHITLVTDSFVDLPPCPSGSGVLADISFTALAPGVSPLTLANVFLNDLDSSSGFMTTDGVVRINGAAVPEPMTVTLLAMGLGAAVGHHWRRTRLRRVQRRDKESVPVTRKEGSAEQGGCSDETVCTPDRDTRSPRDHRPNHDTRPGTDHLERAVLRDAVVGSKATV